MEWTIKMLPGKAIDHRAAQDCYAEHVAAKHSNGRPLVAGLGACVLTGLALSLAACSMGKPSPQAVEARQMAHQQKQAVFSAETTYSQRLDQIPPPSKSLYLAIRTQGAWKNPVLVIEPGSVRLRYQSAIAENAAPTEREEQPTKRENLSTQPYGHKRGHNHAHPHESAGKAEPNPAQPPAPVWQKISLEELPQALTALPKTTWPYGRVITVEDAPAKSWRDRVQIRRNEEAALKVLDDMGVVAYEWPSRNSGF